jgi:hypothetical protein
MHTMCSNKIFGAKGLVGERVSANRGDVLLDRVSLVDMTILCENRVLALLVGH